MAIDPASDLAIEPRSDLAVEPRQRPAGRAGNRIMTIQPAVAYDY